MGPLLDDGAPRLQAVITVGDDGGRYGYFDALYGSISLATFHGKTITAIGWTIGGSGSIQLRLSGTSLADTDASFTGILIGGAIFLRSAASYTADDGAGNTLWTWGADTSAYATSGSVSFAVL